MKTGSTIFLLLAGLAICNGADLEDMAKVSSNRLVNGQLAYEGQFPYAVSIQLLLSNGTQTEDRGHRCGGALFTRSHVVTAASCLNFQLLSANEMRVFAGAVLLTNDTSSDRVRGVSNITIHPEYTGPPAFVNDVAVLALPVPFAENVVTPAALPSSNHNPPDFTTCTVTGWGGYDMTSQASLQLRYVHKYIYNQNLCMSIYNSMIGATNILPSMVCAVSLDLLSSNCNGDYGNPLVCAGTFTGILSQSDGCSRSSFPEIYTRISNQTRWLRSVSGSSAIYAPGVFVTIAVFSVMQILFTA
ncbi:serine protease 30-like [Maniola jurtina]|uniref:serine protease 30-like n=1 Tax=Maniola jurtina TaxID=191418 RepID=UPI001E68F75D|nr:serine protease 30-like [Maniola jurtina]